MPSTLETPMSHQPKREEAQTDIFFLVPNEFCMRVPKSPYLRILHTVSTAAMFVNIL